MHDYCDLIWSPTSANLNCLIERVHSKFLNKLPPVYHSRFSFTLTEWCKLHKFSSQYIGFPLPIYIKIFSSQGMWQVMSAVISITFLSSEYLPILVKEVFYRGAIQLYYGTVYYQMCMRLPPCHCLKIYISILIDFLVQHWFLL